MFVIQMVAAEKSGSGRQSVRRTELNGGAQVQHCEALCQSSFPEKNKLVRKLGPKLAELNVDVTFPSGTACLVRPPSGLSSHEA